MTKANTAKVGDVMADKTVYAGEPAGKALYAAPANSKLHLTFNEAAKYVSALNRANYLGHNDWRVPTQAELAQLFKSRNEGAFKGTFNQLGLPEKDNLNQHKRTGWYWTSKQANQLGAYGQQFSDGSAFTFALYLKSAVRAVR